MPLTSIQVGELNKAYIFDDFNSAEGSAVPNSMQNRFPDFFWRDPAFYAENTTYDPRYNNYNLGNTLEVSGGNVVWLTDPMVIVEADQTVTIGGTGGLLSANYIQVNGEQQGQLATSYGGNIIWKMLDFTIDLGSFTGSKTIPLVSKTRQSRQATDRNNPIWRFLIDNGISPVDVPAMELIEVEYTKQNSSFTAVLVINNTSGTYAQFALDALGYIPDHFIVISAGASQLTGVGEDFSFPDSGTNPILWYGGRIIPISSGVTNIYAESTTNQASGVQYNILINGESPTSVKIPFSAVEAQIDELGEGINLKKAIITNNRMSVENRRFEYNWYDSNITFTMLNPSVGDMTYHKVGIGLGFDADYWNGNTGWKVGAI
jgi:hypothetical protein